MGNISKIGERLREWRSANKWTQTAFASLLSVHVGMVRKWEGGAANPGSEALGSIADTGVNVHWLITGDGDMRAQACSQRYPGKIDAALLARALRVVDEELAQRGIEMEYKKKG